MKKEFLIRIRANVQYGKRINFAKLLRLAAYEISATDEDMRAMLQLLVLSPLITQLSTRSSSLHSQQLTSFMPNRHDSSKLFIQTIHDRHDWYISRVSLRERPTYSTEIYAICCPPFYGIYSQLW